MQLVDSLPYTIVVVCAVAVHFAFICYLVVGGLLAWRWPATFVLHVMAVLWGVASLTLGLPCPLTDLERFGRAGAGMSALPPEGFIEHYLTGVWYPADSAVTVQLLIFVVVAGSWLGLARLRMRSSSAGVPARRVTAIRNV